ncbi:hypothetical protein B0H17DRAFT_1140105 [Mycena rosella]|uniref:Uncharacterized protein n=1 Tax=Mycena rosella TaxID=1033263 RepID=A0AAD7GAH0_MYCRO|nr:hypothetical protein B0H17DRAFT_1140105 [Mycena rosella]
MSRLGNFHQIGWGDAGTKIYIYEASQFGHYRYCLNWEIFTKKVGEDVGTSMWLCGAVIDTAVSRAGYLATERAQRAAGLPQKLQEQDPQDTGGAPTLGGWAPPMILDRLG